MGVSARCIITRKEERCNMTITDILSSVKFVVNPDGRQSAVVVDLEVWEQIIILLEDAEDAEELKQVRTVNEEVISWKTAKKDLQLVP